MFFLQYPKIDLIRFNDYQLEFKEYDDVIAVIAWLRCNSCSQSKKHEWIKRNASRGHQEGKRIHNWIKELTKCVRDFHDTISYNSNWEMYMAISIDVIYLMVL